MQTLDDAWNNQDWETFEARHGEKTVVLSVIDNAMMITRLTDLIGLTESLQGVGVFVKT